MRTLGEITNQFLVRNNISTTDGFVDDTTIQGWSRDAHIYCAGYKKWPMTEGRVSTTFASLVSDDEGFLVGEYPEGWKADSIRLLKIGGKRVDKKNFYKFQNFIEDNPASDARVFSDYNRRYYVNPNIDLSGTITLWGQYTPVSDYSDPSAETIFSRFDEEGNEAIVMKMTAYLKAREHETEEEKSNNEKADAQLDKVFGKVKEEQFGYQDTDNDGIFKRFDVVNGGFRDDIINRDQFNQQ